MLGWLHVAGLANPGHCNYVWSWDIRPQAKRKQGTREGWLQGRRRAFICERLTSVAWLLPTAAPTTPLLVLVLVAAVVMGKQEGNAAWHLARPPAAWPCVAPSSIYSLSGYMVCLPLGFGWHLSPFKCKNRDSLTNKYSRVTSLTRPPTLHLATKTLPRASPGRGLQRVCSSTYR